MGEFAWNVFAVIGATQTFIFTTAALAIIVMVLKPDKPTEAADAATA